VVSIANGQISYDDMKEAVDDALVHEIITLTVDPS
jgi:hypothetical protein